MDIITKQFQFQDTALTARIDEQGASWFAANEVCAILGFGNPHQALKSHVDGDDLQKLEVIDNMGRNQVANFINESGLYALIFGSTKPEAKQFKRWVTSEVLPALRRDGYYLMSTATETQLEAAQTRIRALQSDLAEAKLDYDRVLLQLEGEEEKAATLLARKNLVATCPEPLRIEDNLDEDERKFDGYMIPRRVLKIMDMLPDAEANVVLRMSRDLHEAVERIKRLTRDKLKI